MRQGRDSVSTFLGRRAVVVAAINRKHVADHLAIDDIAIVADLGFVYDAIAATANIDAN